MRGSDPEKHLGGSAWGAAALLPVMQCPNTDTQQARKPALRQANLFPRGGDALVPTLLLCSPKRFGVNRASGKTALSIRAHFPNICRCSRAARDSFRSRNHFLHAARFHKVTFRFSSSILDAAKFSCSFLAYTSKSKILSADTPTRNK
jgi:hypothetical protein